MLIAKIAAIIILYNPDQDVLENNILAVSNQVDVIVLVDNSSHQLTQTFWEKFSSDVIKKIEYIFNSGNLGVAKAQNIGIRRSMDSGFDYILILDQDSTTADQMVNILMRDLDYLQGKNIRIASIAPDPVNVQTQSSYKPRLRRFRPFFAEAPNIIDVPQLISSGSLISKKVFEEVGLMDEFLFIDGVDHEWCWRALTKGYKCALTKNARLYHMLGEGDRKFLGIRIAITSPFRVYYQYRNYIYLCFKSYVPIYWKLNNGFKYAIKFFYYPLFISPRKIYFKNILSGIRSGFKALLSRKYSDIN